MRKTLEAEMEKPGNVVKSDEEWRKTLTPEEYRVTRQHGTERAFSHPYSQGEERGHVSLRLLRRPPVQL